MNRMWSIKLLVIALLMFVIWAALLLVGNVVQERQQYRDQAVTSIAESYAGAQGLVGPVLVQPYTKRVQTQGIDATGKPVISISQQEVSQITFPAKLTMTGTLTPSERHHGLYRAAVYVLNGKLSGWIDAPDTDASSDVVFGEPYLAFELRDVRGIIGMPVVRVNGVAKTMVQGGLIRGPMEELMAESVGARALPITRMTPQAEERQWQPNLRVRLAGVPGGRKARYDFEVELQLAGTQQLRVAPVADLNEISLSSTWPSPLFAGKFLPRTPQVGREGFQASWNLASIATATQQQIIVGGGEVDSLSVSLLTPIDPYKLSDRATKYGMLFVVLTFGGFFIFEVMKQLPIHPVQYLLVGFGLAVFFLLLISFSEHMRFGAAYLLASAACIGLLTFYLSYVLHSMVRGLGFGAMLAMLYGAVYGLLISEDNALVLGSLMMFAAVAAAMVVTRRVDWYRGSAELMRVKAVQASESVPPPAA